MTGVFYGRLCGSSKSELTYVTRIVIPSHGSVAIEVEVSDYSVKGESSDL